MEPICCKMCNQPFGDSTTSSRPLVIACGHSFCQSCISQILNNYSQTFQCPNCMVTHSTPELKFAPVNLLFYEMLGEMNEYLKRAEWERQYNPPENDSRGQEQREFIDEEYKCLYPFCHRLRYQKGELKEVFCSPQCKQKNEDLYQ